MTDWRTAMNWRSELEAIIEAVLRDQLPDAIGECERLKAVLWTRLLPPPPGGGVQTLIPNGDPLA